MSIYQGAMLSKPKTKEAAASRVKRGLESSIESAMLKRTKKQKTSSDYAKEQAKKMMVDRPMINPFREAQPVMKRKRSTVV